MAHLLNIESSPRGGNSASITVAAAFLAAYQSHHPETTIDTLNVWEEDLPEYDSQAIGAKYKGAAGEQMEGVEAALWERIKSLAERFRRADRILLGVPMWNFAYPYKLKQLIDLACQRNLMFSFDGSNFGPLLSTERALVIYTQGQGYAEDSPSPASKFDFQTDYINFWLKFIGVREVQTLIVENTWGDQADARIKAGSERARELAEKF